jgi:hypothetical protein
MSATSEYSQYDRIVAITRRFGLTVVEEAGHQKPVERDLVQAATNLLDVEVAVNTAQAWLRREVDALAKAVLEPDSGVNGSVASAGSAFASFVDVASRVGAALREVELTGDAYSRSTGKKKSER